MSDSFKAVCFVWLILDIDGCDVWPFAEASLDVPVGVINFKFSDGVADVSHALDLLSELSEDCGVHNLDGVSQSPDTGEELLHVSVCEIERKDDGLDGGEICGIVCWECLDIYARCIWLRKDENRALVGKNCENWGYLF